MYLHQGAYVAGCVRLSACSDDTLILKKSRIINISIFSEYLGAVTIWRDWAFLGGGLRSMCAF